MSEDARGRGGRANACVRCDIHVARDDKKPNPRAIDRRAEQPTEAVELLDHPLAEGAARDGRLVRIAMSSPA